MSVPISQPLRQETKERKSTTEQQFVAAYNQINTRISTFTDATILKQQFPTWPSEVNKGIGLRHIIINRDEVSGVDPNQTKDAVSVVAEIINKKTQESMGTYLFSIWFYENFASLRLDLPEPIEVDGKQYLVTLRGRRVSLPYKIYLEKFNHKLYPGTNRPKDFSSEILLKTDQDPKGRPIKIWMNNPLRYDGKTFYQSSFLPGDAGTVLQVVENQGWMIPYLSCMIVGIGMAAVFGTRLIAFLKKREAQR